ncbi:MAG TPA: hypothetical protein VHI31_08655 [Actinomycetota bacterium]|nr:hypothetical protein [Actinomycetota bacterium]
MDRVPAVRRSSEFIGMDLGVHAAKAICDRFGGQVMGYSAEGTKGSITIRIPSRRERFAASAARYQAARAGAVAVRQRTAEILDRTEQNGRRNRALRNSLAKRREALRAARMESRQILNGSAEAPERRAGH